MAERRHLAAPELPLHLLDFFLRVSRRPAEIEVLHARGVSYDAFAQFELDLLPAAEFVALWRRHEATIRSEARRRGLPVPDPSSYRPVPEGCWVRSVDPTR